MTPEMRDLAATLRAKIESERDTLERPLDHGASERVRGGIFALRSVLDLIDPPAPSPVVAVADADDPYPC